MNDQINLLERGGKERGVGKRKDGGMEGWSYKPIVMREDNAQVLFWIIGAMLLICIVGTHGDSSRIRLLWVLGCHPEAVLLPQD